MIQQKEKSNLMNWEIVSVNPNNKIWNWKDLFCFWGSNIQSIIGFSLIASLYLVYQLNFFVVLAGSFLRLSMGIYGARYVAILRGLVGVFMFGVQTYFISKSVGYLIRISLFSIDSTILDKDIFLLFFMGLNTIDWFSLIFAFWIQYLLFSNGQRLIKAIINFSALFVYLGLIIFFMILISENYNEIKNSFNDLFLQNNDVYNKENLIAILSVAGTFFAYFSIFFSNTYLTFIALLFILVASASTNLVANYIPSQNSIINFFPNKSSLRSAGLIIIFLGIILAVFWDPILSKIGILSFIDTIGSFFGPIAGVMLIDYYFIKNKKVINKDIFSSNKDGAYYYSGGWQIKSIYSLFIGFIFASATIWNAELSFLQPFSWIIGAVFSSITYYLLASK